MTGKLSELQYADKWKYPCGVYLYRIDGMHNGAKWCDSPAEFLRLIPKIWETVGEVRITNGGDEMLFHSNGGKTLFCIHDAPKELRR